MFRIARAIVVGAGIGLACGGAARPEDRPAHALVQVFLEDLERQVDDLVRRGYDIAHVNRRAGTIDLVLTPSGLDEIQAAGYRYKVLQVSRRTAEAFGERAAGAESIEVDPLYKDPSEVFQILQTTAQAYPAIARRVIIGGTNFPRAIHAMKISDNVNVDEDEPTILFNGQHHAREVMSTEVPLDIIEYLTTRYATDPDVQRWVNDYEIWVVPSVNPDGANVVFTSNDFWRKNTRDNNGNGVFDSGDGVDLNRNYPFQWGGVCNGSSSTPSSETYRGSRSESEPETLTMTQLEREIHPVFAVDYHSYGEEVYYAYGCDPVYNPQLSTIAPAPDQSISRVIGQEFASRLVQADGGLGFPALPNAYGVDGNSRDHQFYEFGTIAFVVELNTAGEGGFHPPYNTWRNTTVQGQRPGWQYLLDRIHGPSISGHVRVAGTNLPLEAEVSLDEMTVRNGEVYYSEGAFGRYHLIVVPGTYHLRVRAPGYQEKVVTVNVGSTTALVDVALDPVDGVVLLRDDFEGTGLPWTVGSPGDDATQGQWVWGDPHGSFSGTHPGIVTWAAPEFDRTTRYGTFAWVTGNPPAPAFGAGDVDGGTTSLVSPNVNASAHYGVRASYHRRFFKSGTDPQDTFVAEVSNDGGLSWMQLERLDATTASPTQAQAWMPASFLLDTRLPLSGTMKLRFRATDRLPDNTVEAAVDDVLVTGIPRSSGLVRDLRIAGAAATVVSFSAVPGGPAYDVIRGDLSALRNAGTHIDLGSVVCIEDDSPDTDTSGMPDTAQPAEGEGFFYLARFNLGYSVGSYGTGTGGLERRPDPASPARCAP